MAKQDINLGTQPTGVGGDTNRSANLKTNANLKEIYTALGGSVSGGNGSVLPDSLPVSRGGTGATTAAAARTNLGLGNAALRNVGSAVGDLVQVAQFGIGSTNGSASAKPHSITVAPVSGFYTAGPAEGFGAAGCVTVMSLGNGSRGAEIYVQANQGPSSSPVMKFRAVHGSAFTTEQEYFGMVATILHDRNTTVDSNGFIKRASPIVQLYADKIELNDEAQQQNITFEKIDVGDYLIKGSSGLAQSGWYVEQPKDANGNVFHAVVYDTLENGDISVKTYEQKMDGVKIVADLDKPVDVKENRFISIRLHELPQNPVNDENGQKPDPTITDYQGNPAPSRLHELVDGTWTISGENAAILENERLSAIPALTRRQFRLALVLNGYNLADIETLINSIEDPMQRQITMIEWQDATTFHRTNPSLIVMAGLMGLGAETVDQLWLQASTL